MKLHRPITNKDFYFPPIIVGKETYLISAQSITQVYRLISLFLSRNVLEFTRMNLKEQE